MSIETKQKSFAASLTLLQHTLFSHYMAHGHNTCRVRFFHSPE